MIIQFENGKWIQRVRFENGKEMFVERWINDQDQLVVVSFYLVKEQNIVYSIARVWNAAMLKELNYTNMLFNFQ